MMQLASSADYIPNIVKSQIHLYPNCLKYIDRDLNPIKKRKIKEK